MGFSGIQYWCPDPWSIHMALHNANAVEAFGRLDLERHGVVFQVIEVTWFTRLPEMLY